MSTDKARALRDEAAKHAAAGRLEQALRGFRQALELAPRDPGTWQRVGDILRRLGKAHEAIAAYQRATGQFALDGQLLKAIALCRVILQLAPEHQETQKTLAELYARREETDRRMLTLPAAMTPVDVMPLRAVSVPPPSSAPLEMELTRHAPAPMQVDPSALRRIPLFGDLDPQDFLALVGGLELRTVSAGATIVREGEPGSSLFCLVEGSAQAMRGSGANAVVLSRIEEGAFFGEMALLAGAARTASVVALEECRLLELGRDQLTALGQRHPEVQAAVQRHFKGRVLDDLLRVSPLFRPFGPAERLRLLDAFHVRSFPAGTVLLQEGRPGIGLYVILRGRCVAFQVLPDGRENPYPPMVEGDVFGELSLLRNQPVSATVRAQTESIVIGISHKAFFEIVSMNPEAAAYLTALGAQRLERTRAFGEANWRAFEQMTI